MIKQPRAYNPNAAWKKDHDPEARPLGCNGKYGDSGRKLHQRQGTKACQACRDSANHAERERARGQNTPRILRPCGTPAAVTRHRRRGEPLDFDCALAETKMHNAKRARAREKAKAQAKADLEQLALRLAA